ncbi:MAG: hypothetical protein ACRCWN_00210 [Fusobacteriaceae bacterium]
MLKTTFQKYESQLKLSKLRRTERTFLGKKEKTRRKKEEEQTLQLKKLKLQ